MSRRATVRFYAELRDFLPADLGSEAVIRSFEVPGSVKDMIEACGVPHTEVDLILASGRSVGFSHLVDDGEHISVYPTFRSLDITPIVEVRRPPLRTVRFVADTHLGRLARFLRLLGLDTRYETGSTDPDLVEISVAEERILLTRDVALLKHGSVTHGHYVRSSEPREQVVEVVRRFELAHHLEPYTRCMACNGDLVPVAKAEIEPRLPPSTRRHVDEFHRCRSCDKVYWRGAHEAGLQRIVAAARRADVCP